MAKKKNIHTSKENILQKKVDAVKLESHVISVKKDKHVNFTKEFKYHTSELRNAIDKTVAWAKKEKLGKQTLALLDSLVDGVSVFFTALVKDKREQ
jgi:hypothetical protein